MTSLAAFIVPAAAAVAGIIAAAVADRAGSLAA
jgi:hypothetical protein